MVAYRECDGMNCHRCGRFMRFVEDFLIRIGYFDVAMDAFHCRNCDTFCLRMETQEWTR